MSLKRAVVESSIDAFSSGLGSYVFTAFLSNAGDSIVSLPLAGDMSLAMASAVSQGALILGDDLVYQQFLQKYVPPSYRYILDTTNFLSEFGLLAALPSLIIYMSNSGKLTTSDALKLMLLQTGGIYAGKAISGSLVTPLVDQYL